MSYILDALKKSEQERGHGHIPSVQTVHTSSLNYNNKKTYWPYVLITAVILNLAAIIYFYLNKNEPDIVSTYTNIVEDGKRDLQISQAKISEPDKYIPSTDRPSVISPEKTNTFTVQKGTNFATNSPEPIKKNSKPAEYLTKDTVTDTYHQSAVDQDHITQNNEPEIIDFYDLPESIKRQLPSITISAHVYSDNPLQRSIVVNNDFLEEGERILDDLILQEITKDGAIMNYQGTVFRYGVVSGWQ